MMSYMRVILSGTIGPTESWSISPAFNETTNVTTWDQLEGQAAADAIAAIAPSANMKAASSTAVAGTLVRVERRTDAHALLGAAEAPWTGFGTSTQSATKAAQTSIVLSLRSNVPGSRGRGRLYWPGLGAVISTSTLRLTTPSPSAMATGAVTFLDAIETALKGAFHPSPSLIDFHLCVVSPTTGTRTDITRIEVGDILDTQRRRRDKLPEIYASAAYP